MSAKLRDRSIARRETFIHLNAAGQDAHFNVELRLNSKRRERSPTRFQRGMGSDSLIPRDGV